MPPVDASLLRFRLSELVIAATIGPVSNASSMSGSARVTGLHPLISVACALGFRINKGQGGTAVPTTAVWSVSALARDDSNADFRALSGSPLVTNNLLPDGFETASAAPGLQFDFTVVADGAAASELGEWVLTVEATPVDAELLRYPDLLRSLYQGLRVVALQPKLELALGS